MPDEKNNLKEAGQPASAPHLHLVPKSETDCTDKVYIVVSLGMVELVFAGRPDIVIEILDFDAARVESLAAEQAIERRYAEVRGNNHKIYAN